MADGGRAQYPLNLLIASGKTASSFDLLAIIAQQVLLLKILRELKRLMLKRKVSELKTSIKIR